MSKNTSVYDIARTLNPIAITHMNEYLSEIMRTRGGRVGSGMGSVLETLWGYNLNRALRENDSNDFEIAWFPDHQYHDFACLCTKSNWNSSTKEGEFFRIEAKSMIIGSADEPKAHFDVTQKELDEDDAILLLVWRWTKIDDYHVCPEVIDCFFERAIPLAELRDVLHLQRGGSFVDSDNCPDTCAPDSCRHDGEPLNADGKRERKSGPIATRVSSKTSHAQNFGGMLRMLKTAKADARIAMRDECKDNQVANDYVDFIHRNFPKEELNHYSVKEWRTVACHFNISETSKDLIHEKLLAIGREKYIKVLSTL